MVGPVCHNSAIDVPPNSYQRNWPTLELISRCRCRHPCGTVVHSTMGWTGCHRIYRVPVWNFSVTFHSGPPCRCWWNSNPKVSVHWWVYCHCHSYIPNRSAFPESPVVTWLRHRAHRPCRPSNPRAPRDPISRTVEMTTMLSYDSMTSTCYGGHPNHLPFSKRRHRTSLLRRRIPPRRTCWWLWPWSHLCEDDDDEDVDVEVVEKDADPSIYRPCRRNWP